jgi:hypothetical protein
MYTALVGESMRRLPLLAPLPVALAALITLTAGNALAHGMSAADQQAMLDAGYLLYGWLGAKHMLTGYDHLLFIFGVVFFLTGFRDIVKYITAFTLGHSITLIFATLLTISANYYLVDAVIALSVCYKGFDNLDGFRRWCKWEPPNLAGIIFTFGLIHGFGLSTRLQQLPLGDDTGGLVGRILSFNVGVEVGQVAALVIMVALLTGWRSSTSFKRFAAIANAGLVAAGLLLFAMQMHSYSHTVFLEDYPINPHDHTHQHELMDLQKKAERFSDNLLE